MTIRLRRAPIGPRQPLPRRPQSLTEPPKRFLSRKVHSRGFFYRRKLFSASHSAPTPLSEAWMATALVLTVVAAAIREGCGPANEAVSRPHTWQERNRKCVSGGAPAGTHRRVSRSAVPAGPPHATRRKQPASRCTARTALAHPRAMPITSEHHVHSPHLLPPHVTPLAPRLLACSYAQE